MILGQDAKKGNKYVKNIKLKAGELIALSDFVQDEFEKNHGIRPQHVIPAAIDIRQFSDMQQERDIDILAAGSLIPLKQYDIFIEIITEMKKELPGIKAALIGNGPEKEKLQNLIAASGLKADIILTGELPHPEVCRKTFALCICCNTSGCGSSPVSIILGCNPDLAIRPCNFSFSGPFPMSTAFIPGSSFFISVMISIKISYRFSGINEPAANISISLSCGILLNCLVSMAAGITCCGLMP